MRVLIFTLQHQNVILVSDLIKLIFLSKPAAFFHPSGMMRVVRLLWVTEKCHNLSNFAFLKFSNTFLEETLHGLHRITLGHV